MKVTVFETGLSSYWSAAGDSQRDKATALSLHKETIGAWRWRPLFHFWLTENRANTTWNWITKSSSGYHKDSSFHAAGNSCKRSSSVLVQTMRFFTLFFSTDHTFSVGLRDLVTLPDRTGRTGTLCCLFHVFRLGGLVNRGIVSLRDPVIGTKSVCELVQDSRFKIQDHFIISSKRLHCDISTFDIHHNNLNKHRKLHCKINNENMYFKKGWGVVTENTFASAHIT